MVICDKEKIADESCHGAPDLVIEILSPSNTATEMEKKFLLYKEAGVREYWIVDSKNNILRVHCFQDSDISTKTYKSADTAPFAILPGFSIALEQVFA
jgi:Uma2 family endonuclease